MYAASQAQGVAGAGSDQQQLQQRLKQQQALMQQAMLQQQQGLYHAGLMPLNPIEPIPSGNLPPGFDSSSCRSV